MSHFSLAKYTGKRPLSMNGPERAWNKNSDEQPSSRCLSLWKQVCPGRKRQRPPGSRQVGPPLTVGSKRFTHEARLLYKMAGMDTRRKCFPLCCTGWSHGVRRPHCLPAVPCKKNCKSSWECRSVSVTSTQFEPGMDGATSPAKRKKIRQGKKRRLRKEPEDCYC